jgi:hypothetical protein
MTPNELKSQLAPMVAENRNREAMAFVRAHLSDVRATMTAEDRMLVADWMEGVETALDLESAAASASERASA